MKWKIYLNNLSRIQQRERDKDEKSIKEIGKEQNLAQSLAHCNPCVRSSGPSAFNKVLMAPPHKFELCVAYSFSQYNGAVY